MHDGAKELIEKGKDPPGLIFCLPCGTILPTITFPAKWSVTKCCIRRNPHAAFQLDCERADSVVDVVKA